MTTLYQKIMQIYPSLTNEDFAPIGGSISLQNDGNGDYIKSWSNSNPQPTQAQLDAIS